MSRPDLAEIVSAVLAELGQATTGGLARGPGGRPEVPMRRGAAATPPVTVAEATACSPRGRAERDAPASGSDAGAPQGSGMSRSRPRRPSVPAPAAPGTSAAPARAAGPAARAAGPETVQRIVADLQRRLDEPTRG